VKKAAPKKQTHAKAQGPPRKHEFFFAGFAPWRENCFFSQLLTSGVPLEPMVELGERP
jgi:hypothetical protein